MDRKVKKIIGLASGGLISKSLNNITNLEEGVNSFIKIGLGLMLENQKDNLIKSMGEAMLAFGSVELLENAIKKKNLNVKTEMQKIAGLEDYEKGGIYGNSENFLNEVYQEIKQIEGVEEEEEIGEIEEEIEGIDEEEEIGEVEEEIEGIDEEEEIGEVEEEIEGIEEDEEKVKVSIFGNSENELIS
jgi:hypothetical protein